MEQELQNLNKKLDLQDTKIEALYKSVEKTRKYFLVAMWVSIGAVVLPLLGLLFAIPSFISTYTEALSGI